MKQAIKIPMYPVIIFLFTILLIVSCKKEQATAAVATNTGTNTNTTDTSVIRYLALGDSYTIGQGVPVNDRFPAQTAALLRPGLNKDINVTYIATTGWTTMNLINAINSQNPPSNNDIVTLLIGVNDQYQRMDTGTYRTRFTQLLTKSIELAGNRKSRVFVLSIPDYSATPFVSPNDKARVSKEIDWFNAINKQVTMSQNIIYIDITPSTRQAANDPSLIATDGLHPSGKEYAKWAQMLSPVIQNALK